MGLPPRVLLNTPKGWTLLGAQLRDSPERWVSVFPFYS